MRRRSRGRHFLDDFFFFAAVFSRRTPLNFLAAFLPAAGFFTAMNSPEVLLRLVQAVAPPSLVFNCVRFFTAPLRALSPTGLFTAILISHTTAPRGS